MLGAVHQVLVSTGGADPRVQAIDRGRAATFAVNDLLVDGGIDDYAWSDVLLPVAVANHTLVVASERAVVPGVDAIEGLRSFIGQPRIFVASIGAVEGGPESIVFQADLLADGVTTIARAGSRTGRSTGQSAVVRRARKTRSRRRSSGERSPERSAEGRRSVGASLLMNEPLSVVGGDGSGWWTSPRQPHS